MKNVALFFSVISILFTSCTAADFVSIVLPSEDEDITTHELFDADCVPGKEVLDSFYVEEVTKAMLPYDNTNRLIFKNENGERAIFDKEEKDLSYREEVVERFCVNADGEWSLGTEISERKSIKFDGTLPSGKPMALNGFMNKEKTWFADSEKQTGYYDEFQVYVSDENYQTGRIKFVSWLDAETVNREDIDVRDSALEASVVLRGVEYTDVYVNSNGEYGIDVDIYVQSGRGVIAFTTTEGELFILE